MCEVLLYYDEAMLGHDPRGWDPEHPEWTEAVRAILADGDPDKDLDTFSHPERPQRLAAIVERLQQQPVDGARWLSPLPAQAGQLMRVHTQAHVEAMEALDGRACWLDLDTTAVSPASVQAAKLAAGAGICAVEAIARGEAKRAFCLVRPPGHHAMPDRAKGFCLYNNVAVAAAHARAVLGWRRVLIWDWDLHHGNGTQAIFYREPEVLFIDTHHEAPLYPGSGTLEETGEGEGLGYTVNVPLPAGSGNRALLDMVDKILGPAARAFQPDLILISAGFDGHYLDQNFYLDESGFAALSARLCELADELAQGRLVVMLEGGYSKEALAESSYAVLRALAGNRVDAVNLLENDPGCGAVESARRFHEENLNKLRPVR